MVTMSLNSAVKLVGLFTILNYTWTAPPLGSTASPTPQPLKEQSLSHTSVPESHSVPLLPLASRGQRPNSAAAGND